MFLCRELRHSVKIITHCKIYLNFLKRLNFIIGEEYKGEDCQRIAKRLLKNRENMFRFIEIDEVEPDKNRAERGIRPNTVVRKNIQL